MLQPKGVSKRECEVIWELDYPDRHGLHTEYLLRHIILYSRFPIYGRTLGTRNWKHGNIGACAPGSPRIEFPLDIFGQARDAVRVFPRAREAETKWQPRRGSRRQGGGNRRESNLELLKADTAYRVEVRYRIF